MKNDKKAKTVEGEIMPENPLNNIMMNGMPNLPAIIQSALPVPVKQAEFDQTRIGLWWENGKRRQLVEAKKAEAEIAIDANKTLTAELDSIYQVVTFSAKLKNGFNEFEHLQVMRKHAERKEELTIENMTLHNINMELQNKNLEVNIYKNQAEAASAGFESKITELDYKVRLQQYEDMLKEMDHD